MSKECSHPNQFSRAQLNSSSKFKSNSSVKGAAAVKISCPFLFFKADQNLYRTSKSQEIVNTYITLPLALQDFIALTTLQSFQCVIINH